MLSYKTCCGNYVSYVFLRVTYMELNIFKLFSGIALICFTLILVKNIIRIGYLIVK